MGSKALKSKTLKDGAVSRRMEDRRSVRTTFRLSPEAIDAISTVGSLYGVTQKEAIAYLCEEMEFNGGFAVAVQAGLSGMSRSAVGVRKTYVLDRFSLESIEQIAKKYQTHRDGVLDQLIRCYMKLRIEPYDENLREVAGLLGKFALQAERLADTISGLLGSADTVSMIFYDALLYLEALTSGVESQLRGEGPIDPKDFKQSVSKKYLPVSGHDVEDGGA